MDQSGSHPYVCHVSRWNLVRYDYFLETAFAGHPILLTDLTTGDRVRLVDTNGLRLWTSTASQKNFRRLSGKLNPSPFATVTSRSTLSTCFSPSSTRRAASLLLSLIRPTSASIRSAAVCSRRSTAYPKFPAPPGPPARFT